MTTVARTFRDYQSALRVCYEEEVSGEGFFASLAAQFSGQPREALLLIARMERVTAAVLRPLIARHGIATADHAVLYASGDAEASAYKGISWQRLARRMAEDYPVFMAEFDQLERLAPGPDQASVAVAVEHERVLIAFARRDIAGDPNSLETLREFLDRHDLARPD